jgi:hypothetical protein
MPAASYSAAGVAASLIIAAYNNLFETHPPVVNVVENGAFLSAWDREAAEPPCDFFNASSQYTGGLCSHFAIARMGGGVAGEAVERAVACASLHETECVLSPEIGLAVPAAFVYDAAEGMKMVVAPRFLPEGEGVRVHTKTVALQKPDGTRVGSPMTLMGRVRTEYMDGRTRRLVTEAFDGPSAFCLQLLRLAFEPDCWRYID